MEKELSEMKKDLGDLSPLAQRIYGAIANASSGYLAVCVGRR